MKTKIVAFDKHANVQQLWLKDQKMLLLVRDGITARIKNGDSILEIGTGIHAVLARQILEGLQRKDVDFLLTDIDPVAAAGAKKSVEKYTNVSVVEGDLFSVVPVGKKFNIIFWNPPWYDSIREAKNNGPAFLDEKGYQKVRSFLQQAPNYLQPNGAIFVIFPMELSAAIWEESVNLGLEVDDHESYETEKRRIVLYEITSPRMAERL
jgi:methylase of polypeptide subunit release factors